MTAHAPTPAAPEPAVQQPVPERDAKMTIWEHLEELRRRIVKAFIGIVLTTAVAWYFRVQILAFVLIPYEHEWSLRFKKTLVLQTLAPADALLGYMELSITVGIIAAAPIIFYQLWSFISPGLYKKEKRLVIPLVFFSTALFLCGVAFAYYIAYPLAFNCFLSFTGTIRPGIELDPVVTLEHYLDFTTRFHLTFGVVFELPLVISFLVLANIITPKQIVKFGRWAIVLSFAIGAVASPGTDVTAQVVLAGALIGLYSLSIPIAYLLKPRSKDTAIAKTLP